MGSNLEQVEVRFCDICGEKETLHHSMSHCWKCGKDCCERHSHLVHVEGEAGKFLTYLCDPDRDEMKKKLEALFDEFRTDWVKRQPLADGSR